jgi:hypothetical protein
MVVSLGLSFGLVNIALPKLYVDYFGVAAFPLLIGIGTCLSGPLGLSSTRWPELRRQNPQLWRKV